VGGVHYHRSAVSNEMKTVLPVSILVLSVQVFAPFAQCAASDWFPMNVGNQWVYEHESRDSPESNPYVTRWQTVETITGALAIPEGMVVLRRVEVRGDASRGWLQSVYGESNYLIRNDCLYFLNPQTWDEKEQTLRPEYRAQILAGNADPEFCFPLVVGKAFGKDELPGWVPSRVVGMGRNGTGQNGRFAPSSVSGNAFDVRVHLVYADETHLWFEKGVGITGMWDWHNGTYGDYRVTLLQFQPAGAKPELP
jgi:hypothetical protein